MSHARSLLFTAASAPGLARVIATPGSGADPSLADPLDEPVGASAAVARGRFDIRSHKHLSAIGSASTS